MLEFIKFCRVETLHLIQITYHFVSNVDKLSTLISRYGFDARVFFNGQFCDANQFHEDGRAGHLHLVREGPVVFTHDHAAPVRIDDPTMVFYPRGMRHRLEVPHGASATLLCANVSFARGYGNPLARALPDFIRVPLAGAGSLQPTLELLFAEAAGAAPGRDAILDRVCDILVIRLLREQLEQGAVDAGLLAALADPHLAPVLDAMHDRPQEPWQLESLSSLARMSRARFTEHFRTVVGVPPVEYLSRWRIGLACRLLRQGMSVKAVSAAVGYTSAPAFTRAFTEHMGMSPRSWLRADDAPAPADRAGP